MKDLLKKVLYFFLVLVFINSCKEEKPRSGLKLGIWRGEITAQNNQIPFNFKIYKQNDSIRINLINGEEIIPIDEVFLIKDTISFNMFIFDSEIKGKIDSTSINGFYTKNYIDNYSLPLKAKFNKPGRIDHASSNGRFDGTWETVFKNSTGRKTKAIGIFKTKDSILHGTFLTTTGDFRYLDGYTDRDTLFLYSFDGNHLFKFKAHKVNDSVLKGEFWSGKSGYKTFVSKRNDTAKLPDPDKITYLKEGFDKIDFSFKDLEGKPVSLNDEKYKGKVVILQIFGTWSPNCIDETRFYADWYKKNKDRGVEIIGLAYENKPDFEYAKSRVEKMVRKLHVEYDFVIAGTSQIEFVSRSLPMLNNVISFPTSIIIDKTGKVRKIHTGFNGPATGKYYQEFTEDFNQFINQLLKE
ncbi:MAG: TlpA family protein disulfide reductase [Flavobacteriia bacterium]|nr:MAG: TlpA family protein disulfide reductase [Flavobacteriia bacterium]